MTVSDERPHHIGGWASWVERDTSFGLAPGWAHHGVVALADGTVITGLADGCHLALLHPLTREVHSIVPVPVTECHGMSLDNPHSPDSSVWIADNGFKPMATGVATEEPLSHAGRAVLVDQKGALAQEILDSSLPDRYRGWRPTSVISWEDDVWVADGYGHSVLHRFRRNGEYVGTFDGAAGGLAFRQPHALAIDTRGTEPRLLVADRGNTRVVVLTPEGVQLSGFGAGIVTSPSAFAFRDDELWITELHGGLIVFGANDEYLRSLGVPLQNRHDVWPHIMDDSASIVRPPLRPGTFRSPHGVAILPTGEVAVTEWILGGRLIIARES